MKQSDIITVVIIAVVGTLAAYFGVNAILGNPSDATFDFKTITPITAEIDEPDPEVFNRAAINPTVEVFVGECADLDQNGTIDKAEAINCGKTNVIDVEDESNNEEDESDNENIDNSGNGNQDETDRDEEE